MDCPDLLSRFKGPREPSISEKWALKRIAWSNGCRPIATRHRLILGDARDLPLRPEGDVHLVVTSPPYFNLIEYVDTPKEKQIGFINDYEDFLAQLDMVWERCYRRLAPGGRLCVIIGDVCVPRRRAGRHHVIPLHADIALRCRKIGFDYLTPILWAKIANASTEVAGAARFLGKPYEPNGIIKNDIEYILMFRKPGHYRTPSVVQRALSVLDKEEHDLGYRSVWTDIPGQSRVNGHPAPFPVALAERLIRLFSFVDDTVLDPFVGSGSTTVAAIRCCRSSLGYDIAQQYLKMARDRAAKETGPVPAQISLEETI